MQHQKTLWGLVAALSISATAGIALPCVNVLKPVFTAEQLLTARGLLTALIALVWLLSRKENIFHVDRYTYLIGLTVPIASFGLFKGIREWGATPTMIILAATPVLSFLFSWLAGKTVPRSAMVALPLILIGSVLAFWQATLSSMGLTYTFIGLIANAFLYEFFAKAKASALHKCFWGSLGMGVAGLIGCVVLGVHWAPTLGSFELQLKLILFAIVGGFAYWLANLFAFQLLNKDTASVLAQFETPVVILVAMYLLRERLTLIQFIGASIAIAGVIYLTWQSAKVDSVAADA